MLRSARQRASRSTGTNCAILRDASLRDAPQDEAEGLLLFPRHLARLGGLFADFLARRCREFRRRHEAALGVLHLVLGELPALPVDVEDDAVRVLELALEAVVIGIAEIEEELAAGLLDLLLLRRHVVALEAEVVDAGPPRRDAGADLALVLQQREIDLAVAHVAVPGGLALLDLGALEAERILVEVGG